MCLPQPHCKVAVERGLVNCCSPRRKIHLRILNAATTSRTSVFPHLDFAASTFELNFVHQLTDQIDSAAMIRINLFALFWVRYGLQTEPWTWVGHHDDDAVFVIRLQLTSNRFRRVATTAMHDRIDQSLLHANAISKRFCSGTSSAANFTAIADYVWRMTIAKNARSARRRPLTRGRHAGFSSTGRRARGARLELSTRHPLRSVGRAALGVPGPA